MNAMNTRWFVRGDLDGFFGLFIDNLLQLMIIAVLCRTVCNLPPELVNAVSAETLLPFVSILYCWLARLLNLLEKSVVAPLDAYCRVPPLKIMEEVAPNTFEPALTP